jgi:8-oxo-dGTP pyrophosphatase MutT (NUDIX family)
MKVIYTGESVPNSFSQSLFLAGPSPRGAGPSWRADALKHLEDIGYEGVVFSPEARNSSTYNLDYDDQVGWETDALNQSDVIVFWLPRDIEGGKFSPHKMPAFTTNDEWGTWKHTGKCVFGAPPDADNVRYQLWWAEHLGVPNHQDLRVLLQDAVGRVTPGELRTGGEMGVPLEIWRKSEFQEWLQAQYHAGNFLIDTRLEWCFRVGASRRAFVYALWACVWVEAEQRAKSNELVIFRPSVASCVLYHQVGADWLDTNVVLVKEFRTPAANSSGYCYDLPGGSTGFDSSSVEAVLEEIKEETGLALNASRFAGQKPVSRQIAATLMAHKATVWSCPLTSEELVALKADQSVHGVEEDTERTWVVVKTIREILAEQLVDWTTLGAICQQVSV